MRPGKSWKNGKIESSILLLYVSTISSNIFFLYERFVVFEEFSFQRTEEIFERILKLSLFMHDVEK